MARILSLFNHKGGVGKTTLIYSLGWALANKNQRVLMIDGDPQCNLTEFCIGMGKLEGDIESGELNPTIYDLLLSVIAPSGDSSAFRSRKFYQLEQCNRLDLILGDIHFAELDADITLGVRRVSTATERYIPAIYKKISEIGKEYDYILIDLSPSLSSVNQLFLMLSDYFITPVFPGIFSLQALKNLGKIFRTWNRDLSSFDDFKERLPKFLGIVFQNFRPYTKSNEQGTKSAKRFTEDKERLNQETIKLAKDLNGFDMALSQDEFKEVFSAKIPFTIAEVPDFNQIKIIAEQECLPVNALDDKILNKHGLAIPQYKAKRDDFIKVCDDIADSLIKLKEIESR